MKRFGVMDALALVTIAATGTFTAARASRLPERVAVHFDAYGRPDGWAPPAIAAWGPVVFALVVWAFVRLSVYMVRADRRQAAEAAPLGATGLLVAAFIGAIHVMVLERALGADLDMLAIVAGLMGCLLIALGLLMLVTPPNPLVGIRTKWTLASAENWARTHKLAALTFTLSGLASIAAPLMGAPATVFVMLAATVAATAVPTLYSFLLARRGI
jgi:uncharacterized membrane protein